MNLFEWIERSLQSPIKPIPNKSLPEDELKRVKKIWEEIISWTIQRTLQEWSNPNNITNHKISPDNNLNIPNFFM